MSIIYVDDNHGTWDMESADDVNEYFRTQSTNVPKTCVCCGRQVMIQPSYDKCSSCADIIEAGGDPWY